MRTALFSIGLALSAVTATAETTVSLSLTSENGGADTRFTLSYTGTPTWASPVSPIGSFQLNGLHFYSLSAAGWPGVTVTGPTDSFLSSISGNLPNITGLDTGWYWTNPRTGQTSTPSFILLSKEAGALFLRLDGQGTSVSVMSPDDQIVLSGPTSVSFLSGLDFSNFNAGSWINQNFAADTWRANYDLILNVGTAVPEPSTYGLILGGLVLTGAVIRRRIKK